MYLINYVSVPGADYRTVCFTPLAGILAQGKLLPLRYLPLTIELEVVNNLYDPIISTQPLGQAGVAYIRDYLGDIDNSNNWQIQNVVVKCDVCRMDNQLENEFAQRFLSGQSISINFSSYVVQQQTMSGQNPSVNITRALSRLKSVFMTLNWFNNNTC